MSRPKLTLFLDIVSPFAYEAFYVVEKSPIFKKCDVEYVPMFLGGVMKATGNTPPMYIKNKGDWINLERIRWAKQFSIPMTESTPVGFPLMTISVMRALCAVSVSHPDKLVECFKKIYHAIWAESKQAEKAEVYLPILKDILGEDGAASVAEKTNTPEIKQLLLSNTDKALAQGAFGLPWFVATNSKGEKENFWGFDHLGQVIGHLGLDRGEAPIFKALL